MRFCYVVRVKEGECYGVFSTVCEEMELLEECDILYSLGYDIFEIYRVCRFDGLNRPVMLLTANIPMNYEEFCNEVLKDE